MPITVYAPNNNLGLIPERNGIVNWTGIKEFVRPAGTQTHTATPNSGTSLRKFKVRKDQLIRFRREVLGHPFMSAGTMRRHLPLRDYTLPGGLVDDPAIDVLSPLIATKFTSYPFDGGGAQKPGLLDVPWAFEYKNFVVDVQFETVRYDVVPYLSLYSEGGPPVELQRYVITDIEAGGQFLVTEYGQWRLLIPGIADPTQLPPAGTKFGIWEAEHRLVLRWLDVLPEAYNETRAKDYAGKTNAVAFLGRAAKTLLLLAPQKTYYKNVFGQVLYEIRFEFLEKPTGINKHFYWSNATGKLYTDVVNINKPDLLGGEPVSSKDSGGTDVDFNKLFIVP